MRYWCVNCGEPGICVRKTTVCGSCGWDGVSEWEDAEWAAICEQRDRHPVPHPPRQPVTQQRGNQAPKVTKPRAKPVPAPETEPAIQGVMDLEEV